MYMKVQECVLGLFFIDFTHKTKESQRSCRNTSQFLSYVNIEKALFLYAAYARKWFVNLCNDIVYLMCLRRFQFKMRFCFLDVIFQCLVCLVAHIHITYLKQKASYSCLVRFLKTFKASNDYLQYFLRNQLQEEKRVATLAT